MTKFQFVAENGDVVTGTEAVAGYRFADFFDCDIEQATHADLVAAYKGRDSDGIGVEWGGAAGGFVMTADDYRAALSRLGWTQSSAARLVGVDTRTSQRWALGERDIPPPVQRLLAVAESVPGVAEKLVTLYFQT